MKLRMVGVPRHFEVAGAAVLFASLACAQSDPSGHWEGSFTPENREIGLSLDLAKNAKSEWVASMGVPSQNVTGLVVMDLAVDGKTVKFVAVELRMAKFDLTWGPEGTLKGTISSPQQSWPVELKRTGEAKVELTPPSPAVAKELEGDWEGSLNVPNGPIPIVVHLKNRPDRTVAATIDTGNSVGVPLNDIRQTGRKVEFGIRVAHASFQGTLNPENTEIAGQFLHESNGMPLTLRKK